MSSTGILCKEMDLLDSHPPNHPTDRSPEEYTYRELTELFCEYARRPFNPIPLNYNLYR